MADANPHPTADAPPITPGLLPNLRFDLLSGFLVFLIALPLCLGIARASNYPAIAGVWTAVVGGILCSLLSNSQMTIKGPAAGLIVIVEGAVIELGSATVGASAPLLDKIAAGYPLALGVGVTAGVLQILFGLLKAGKLADAVPLTPVHGMLAAIGITIMAKSLFPMVGLAAPGGEPVRVIAAIPEKFPGLNPTVAVIGVLSLVILFAFPLLKSRVRFLKPIPGQLVVLLAAIPLGLSLGLSALGSAAGDPMKYLVNVPDVIPGVFTDFHVAFMLPNFAGVPTGTGIKYVILFALIGSIESLLSTQAVDLSDPWKRKTDMNRDLLAVGAANTLCSAVGALPMISEIVRSKANIDNGARTKYANLFHGVFLLAFVLALPWLIRMIPLAALGAMLVFVGFRLAHPREFVNTYRIGKEQFAVFMTTILVTLSTDLLIGVISGIALEFVFHALHGVPLRACFRSDIEWVYDDADKVVLVVRRAAVFSNWLGLKTAVHKVGDGKEVVLDFSDAALVDHSVMEKLHELGYELADKGGRLTLAGLDAHVALSDHPLAARKRRNGNGGTAGGTPAATPGSEAV